MMTVQLGFLTIICFTIFLNLGENLNPFLYLV